MRAKPYRPLPAQRGFSHFSQGIRASKPFRSKGVWNAPFALKHEQIISADRYDRALRANPLDAESILKNPEQFLAALREIPAGFSSLEHLQVLAHIWKEKAAEVQTHRLQILTDNERRMDETQKRLGIEVVRHPELEALYQKDYLDWYRLTVELFVAKTLAVVSEARFKMSAAGIDPEISGRKRSKTRISTPFHEKSLILRMEWKTEQIRLLSDYENALKDLLEIHRTGKEIGVAAGAEYTRGQKTLTDAAIAYVNAANKRLSRNQQIQLDAFFTGAIPPFRNPVEPKPIMAVRVQRSTPTLGLYAEGLATNRARHIIKLAKMEKDLSPEQRTKVPLLLSRHDLPEGVPFWSWQTWFRMAIDRYAYQLAHEYLEYGTSRNEDVQGYVERGEQFGWDSPELRSWLNANAGEKMCAAADLTVSLEYAPGAEELCRRLSKQFRRVLLVGTHTGTSDTFILQRALPGSSFDSMFGGAIGQLEFVARDDYDRDMIASIGYPAMDQGPIYHTTFLSKKSLDPFLVFCQRLAAGQTGCIYPAGSRNRYNWVHNPFESGVAIAAAHVDLAIPIAITNSTGEEFRGGHAHVIVGRPAQISEFGVKKGRKFDRVVHSDELMRYLWQEQKRTLFQPYSS